jgi:hypothetical protein
MRYFTRCITDVLDLDESDYNVVRVLMRASSWRRSSWTERMDARVSPFRLGVSLTFFTTG